MKQLILFVLLIIGFTGEAQNKAHIISANLKEGIDYLPGTIIVKLKPQYRNHFQQSVVLDNSLKRLLQAQGSYALARKFPHHLQPEVQQNALGLPLIDLSLIYEIRFTGTINLQKLLIKLFETGFMEYAEPHYLPKAFYNPNDTLATVSGQYHLNRINAYNGWNTSQGDTNVIVGITDTGIDFTHADLVGNVKHNYADPINGSDDDGDGYIDNFNGWDVGMNDNDPTWQSNPHGVHVSGIAGAQTDNITGIAGVGFKCKLLPVKISDASGALIAAYDGIVYAADHGAQIINCSWGGTGAGSYGQDIVTYASVNKNALVVAAAGNNNSQDDFYPASYDYVLSVASTEATDFKSGFSNYGYNVDVCAPGGSINATWPGNAYISQSGTSMASPVAAGAAGIVKAQFPSYIGLQVGEQLKATCDDIYSINTTYKNKLGKGRVNLGNALTQTASKSVVFNGKLVQDHNDNAFVIGDTLFISGRFTNYLSPVTNASASIKATIGAVYMSVIDTTTTIGALNTLDTTNNHSDPFKFKINAGTPQNSIITFRVLVLDGAYAANYFFSITVNVDYINITINEVHTSITSKGKTGYNQDGQLEGLGFDYNGTNLLYEGGLLIGTNASTVSDCVRGAAGSDVDFQSSNIVHVVSPSLKSEFDLNGQFTDAPASPSQNLVVTHNAYAWSTPGNTRYVIVEYRIKNNGASALTNLYAGIFADWDIDGSTYIDNKSDYDAIHKMGYTWHTATGGKWAGIKLLTNSSAPVFYAVDNISGGNGGANLFDGFDTAEKYTTLSTNRYQGGNSAPNGNDVINIMSSGPYNLNAGDSAIVAFALIAGDSLADIQKSADSAQVHYDAPPIPVGIKARHEEHFLSVYPNPADKQIHFYCASEEAASISIVNALGQTLVEVRKHAGRSETLKVDVSAFPEGIYIYKYTLGNTVKTGKVLVTR